MGKEGQPTRRPLNTNWSEVYPPKPAGRLESKWEKLPVAKQERMTSAIIKRNPQIKSPGLRHLGPTEPLKLDLSTQEERAS